MHSVILGLHIVTCVLLVLIVLLQAGKSGGLGGMFGGGGSSNEALFSAPSGSSFLKRLTTTLAIVFMLSSLSLTFLSSRKGMKTVAGSIPPIQAGPAEQPAGDK